MKTFPKASADTTNVVQNQMSFVTVHVGSCLVFVMKTDSRWFKTRNFEILNRVFTSLSVEELNIAPKSHLRHGILIAMRDKIRRQSAVQNHQLSRKLNSDSILGFPFRRQIGRLRTPTESTQTTLIASG